MNNLAYSAIQNPQPNLESMMDSSQRSFELPEVTKTPNSSDYQVAALAGDYFFLPIHNFGDYTIRPMKKSDFSEVAKLNDKGLRRQLTEDSLKELTANAYSFERGKDGIMGFVAEDLSGNIIGRAYVLSWNIDDLNLRKFYPTQTGGLELVTSKELIQKQNPSATRIVELGGWLVKDEHRGSGLVKKLAYASMDAIERINEYKPVDMVYVSYPGRFLENDTKINFTQRIYDFLSKKYNTPINEETLIQFQNKGEILSKEEVSALFADFDSPQLNAPRDASKGSYKTIFKFTDGSPLFKHNEKVFYSPYEFEMNNAICVKTGGNFALANLPHQESNKVLEKKPFSVTTGF